MLEGWSRASSGYDRQVWHLQRPEQGLWYRKEDLIPELAAGNAGSGQKDDGHNGTGADTGRNPGDVYKRQV